MLHRVARTYGCLPSDLLRLDAFELALTLNAFNQAQATFAQELGRHNGPVFPVIPLEM